jgi:hypothetical protein
MLWNLQLVKDAEQDGPRKFIAYGRAEGRGWLTLDTDTDTDTDTVAVDGTTAPDNARTKILLVLTGGTEMSTETRSKSSRAISGPWSTGRSTSSRRRARSSRFAKHAAASQRPGGSHELRSLLLLAANSSYYSKS